MWLSAKNKNEMRDDQKARLWDINLGQPPSLLTGTTAGKIMPARKRVACGLSLPRRRERTLVTPPAHDVVLKPRTHIVPRDHLDSLSWLKPGAFLKAVFDLS
jgi:hypothetical protein